MHDICRLSGPSDWLQIVITIKSKCIVCGKDMPPGPAYWSKSSKASKHLTCVQNTNVSPTEQKAATVSVPEVKNQDNQIEKPALVEELLCYLCGSRAGCNECSFFENCNTRTESKYCLCDNCAYGRQNMAEAYVAYQNAFLQKMERIRN